MPEEEKQEEEKVNDNDEDFIPIDEPITKNYP